jgi:hypothetical protein
MTSGQIIYALCTLVMLGMIGRHLYVGEASIGTGSYQRTGHPARYWTIIAFDFGMAALFAYGFFTSAPSGI